MRSLVPMAKKSASAASASAASAAPGTSIIAPRGGNGLGSGMPRRRSRRATCSIASRTRRISLGVRDHRQQDAHRPVGGGAQHRRELRVEQAAVLQATVGSRAGRAPGCRPGHAWSVSERGQLVAADIEGAHRHRLAFHAADQRREHGILLVLARQIVAVHVEKLGAHQPEPHRPVGRRLGQLDAAIRDWLRG